MKTQQETLYIDSKGHQTNCTDMSNATAIDIAQFSHFPSERKQRRSLQSLAARELLNGALEMHTQQNIDDAWLFSKSEIGKPFLVGKKVPSISISHSGDWCACAVSSASCVGVDVEVVKSRDWVSYCTFAFHPVEAQWILEASGRERDVRGLIGWCRKEAVIKAMGVSFSASLSTIAFSPTGELIVFPSEFGQPLDWRFFNKVHADSLVVAVAWKIDSN